MTTYEFVGGGVEALTESVEGCGVWLFDWFHSPPPPEEPVDKERRRAIICATRDAIPLLSSYVTATRPWRNRLGTWESEPIPMSESEGYLIRDVRKALADSVEALADSGMEVDSISLQAAAEGTAEDVAEWFEERGIEIPFKINGKMLHHSLKIPEGATL